jgi:cobalt-zinc-cadmium resistance protein CzcA
VTVGDILEGPLHFPLVVRLPQSWRSDPKAVGAVLVTAPGGERVPLSQLSDIAVRDGPAKILRSEAQRRLVVQCNVRGRDLGGFVAEAQRKVAEQVPLPGGRYRVRWGGQLENLRRAEARLALVGYVIANPRPRDSPV